MKCVEEPEPGVFECSLCGLRAPFNYHGQKPPNARSIVLLEECYTMNDPFTSQKDRFLIIGSHCSVCNSTVCVGQAGDSDAEKHKWSGWETVSSTGY
ncbi:cysteine-rich DPF motif domain-containing protein 1 isoform X2 [Hypanus sabinus]|uniref:cysteine-rich DPF motif domain-containing protein 1 isoform X2 n=1 Tax=Hypanus sabinus TaxID=79690 RepID=UPI0028C47EB1|nr:cysteine-rich DPF motif domain-containing protein 1 isoform X2 [Hypanus sabinus]